MKDAVKLPELNSLDTPAFVICLESINCSLEIVKKLTQNEKCIALYSLKANPLECVVAGIADHVDGFSCSSPNEAELISRFAAMGKLVQIVTPGLTTELIESLQSPPDYLTFNSLEQFYRLHSNLGSNTKIGIRINPKISFVKNEKYDPCRVGSKLGVCIEKALREFSDCESEFPSKVSGIHIHNNCESNSFDQLRDTVVKLKPLLDSNSSIDWVNLGGGYQIEGSDFLVFQEVVDQLVGNYNVDVLFEPGDGLVREAGFLVSTIIDMFDSDGMKIAVLDTTVNHAPEVYEYSWSPPVLGAVPDGRFEYSLVGCSCLAGDLFGKYRFDKRLKIGSKVVLGSLGAYSMPKWSMFNGINLPNIYVLTEDGELVLRKSFTFEDFANRCGVSSIVAN